MANVVERKRHAMQRSKGKAASAHPGPETTEPGQKASPAPNAAMSIFEAEKAPKMSKGALAFLARMEANAPMRSVMRDLADK